MGFDLGFAASTVPLILRSLWLTVVVTLAASVGACALGFCWEMLRRSGGRATRYGVRFLIDAIRSTPILAQLYFLYFVLPFYGVTLPAVAIGVVGLSFYYSGYLSEVFKAGIDAIPSGQWEAAKALGLSPAKTVVLVIAPQMLTNVAAPVGNYVVSVLKATPYLAVLAVPEMLGAAFDIASDTFRYAEPLIVAGIVYLALALLAVHLVHRLERRLLSRLQR
ncbi:amino acid ABC transporter permease [Bosea sp. NPDC055332]